MNTTRAAGDRLDEAVKAGTWVTDRAGIGALYLVVTTAITAPDHEPVVVYRSPSGNTWAMLLTRFDEAFRPATDLEAARLKWPEQYENAEPDAGLAKLAMRQLARELLVDEQGGRV